MPDNATNDLLHGSGTTITFADSSFSGTVHSITGGQLTREAVDVTPLSSASQRQKAATDLLTPPVYQIGFYYNPSQTNFAPITGAREVVTITYPLQTSETAAATETGTGFVSLEGLPDKDAPDRDFLKGTITVAYAGGFNSGNAWVLAKGIKG